MKQTVESKLDRLESGHMKHHLIGEDKNIEKSHNYE